MMNNSFLKSDIGAQSAWKGFSSQTLYIASRLINDDKGYDYYPEDIEDLIIKNGENVIEAVQVKNISSALTISSLASTKTSKSGEGFFKRMCSLHAQYSKFKCIKIVYFGELGTELLDFSKGVLGAKDKLIRKLEENHNVSTSDAKWLLESITFEKVSINELEENIKNQIQEYVPVMPAPDIARLLLIQYISNLSNSKGYTSLALWKDRMHKIGTDIAALDGYYKEYDKSLVRLTEFNINKESAQIQYEYSQGISAHPTHIRMGLDFYRKSWIEKIDAAITHTGVAVVKGVSGQGKSTLCYRYLIDKFSEEFVFCVRSIASESQAQNLVTALLALNKHCENLVVYIDVIPGEYNWAFLLQELQTRGLAVPVLISIRDEDYNATRISGKAILYDIIELQLTKEEAKTIYDNFTAGNPHSQHRSFDEAWINFGGNGPLIEFVYLLTNNQTLTQRLSEQVNTLLQERVPDSWLNLLNIVCFTGRLGCSVDFEHVKNEISCDSMFSAVQRLCDEYLIRVIDDGNRIEVLHPVRAKIIYDILCKLIGDNSDKMVISALKCVESTNSKVILLDYFTNHKYDLIAIEKIAKLTFSDWISYGNVLKVMLWLDVKRYVEDNANCISNLIKKRGKGWLCFIPLDFTGLDRPNEIIAESMLLGLPNINRDSMIQAIEETKASLTSLMLDYKVTDCFLTNSNIPSSMPNTDEGWTLFGYSLFWCSKREIKINLNYEIEQMLNEMKHGDIQSRADAIRGLSEYPELLEYYNIAEDTLIERLIKEFQVIYFHKNNDEVCCKFIPPFVKDSSEQNIEIEKNQNQYWRIKMLDILQQIYPDKEYIDIELIGVNIVDDLGIKPLDYKLRIEKKNRHIQWMSDINAWVKTRIDFELRPDSWNEYVAKIDELRIDANDLVLDTIKCIDDLYKKKNLNKERWDKVVSKMQVFSRHVFAENRLPKSAVDPYCLHTESTKKLPSGEDYPLLQLLSLEKYKKFRKYLSETYTSLENFYNQFQEVLVVRVKNKSIDTVKNPRLAMYNLFTAAKHLLDFQHEYRALFSSYSTLMDDFDIAEIQNMLTLMNVWRTVLDNPIKGYAIAYDAKQKFRKGKDYFEKTVSNFSTTSDFKVHSTETQIYILDEFDLLSDSTLEENYAKTVLLLRKAFSNALIFDSNRWYVETQQKELVYVPLFKGVAMGSAFSIPIYRLLDMDELKLRESILPCEIDDTLIYNFLNLPAERLLLWKDVLANVAGVKVILKQYSEVYFSTKNELCAFGFEAYKNALLTELDTMVHKGEKNKLFVEELLKKADDENKEYLEVVALLLDSIAEIRDKIANEEEVSNEIDIIEKVVGAMVLVQPFVAEV